MEAIIPVPILAWFAGIDPQVWVWWRFVLLVWFSGALITTIGHYPYMRIKHPTIYSEWRQLGDSLWFGALWPVWLFCGFFWLIGRAFFIV